MFDSEFFDPITLVKVMLVWSFYKQQSNKPLLSIEESRVNYLIAQETIYFRSEMTDIKIKTYITKREHSNFV